MYKIANQVNPFAPALYGTKATALNSGLNSSTTNKGVANNAMSFVKNFRNALDSITESAGLSGGLPTKTSGQLAVGAVPTSATASPMVVSGGLPTKTPEQLVVGSAVPSLSQYDKLAMQEEAKVKRANALRSAEAKNNAEAAALQSGAEVNSPDWMNYVARMQQGADQANTDASMSLADYKTGLVQKKHDQNIADLSTYFSLLGDNDAAKQGIANLVLGGGDVADSYKSLFNADGSFKTEYKAVDDTTKQIQTEAQRIASLAGRSTYTAADEALARKNISNEQALADSDVDAKVEDYNARKSLKDALPGIVSGGSDALNALTSDQWGQIYADQTTLNKVLQNKAITSLGTEWDKTYTTGMIDRAVAANGGQPGGFVSLGGRVYRIAGIGGGKNGDDVALQPVEGGEVLYKDLNDNTDYRNDKLGSYARK